MGEGHTFDLTAFVSPVDLVDNTVTWTSSNPAVATVSNGKVTGISGGTAVITATTANGKSGSCTVEIWHSHKVTKSIAPSCVTAGSEVYTCAGCGHSYNKYLGDALGHNYDNKGKCTRCGLVKDTPLRIYSVEITDINSVGGVEFEIYWNNHSSKDIKYIYFHVTPYNRVGDVMKCDIRDRSTTQCYSTGPYKRITSNTDWSDNYYYTPTLSYGRMTLIRNGSYSYGDYDGHKDVVGADFDNIFYGCTWETVWYNSSIDRISLDKVVIEYMDGSKTTLTGSKLARCMY
jgi:hypothetical protein